MTGLTGEAEVAARSRLEASSLLQKADTLRGESQTARRLHMAWHGGAAHTQTTYQN